MDPLMIPAMARQLRRPDQPQCDHPEYQCPYCLDVEPFRSQEGRRRDRHLREAHRQIIVWRSPYCPMGKYSHRFDNLRSHVWAVHRQHNQALEPPMAFLEPLDWREEREERIKDPHTRQIGQSPQDLRAEGVAPQDLGHHRGR